MKSTNSGTCQICGSLQKLPGGRLAKHGYDVRFGFFNGVCSGAGHLPFEQSKDYLEKVVAETEKQIAAHTPATAADFMVMDYRLAPQQLQLVKNHNKNIRNLEAARPSDCPCRES